MYYKIFTGCEFIDGHNQSLVYDIQREKIIPIPKRLSKLFKINDGQSIEQLYKDLEISVHNDLREYIEEFTKEEILFLSKKPIDKKLFPPISYKHEEPNYLSNIIVSFFNKDNISFIIDKLLDVINETKSKYIQLRFEKGFTRKKMDAVFKSFDNSIVRHLSILVDRTDSLKNNLDNLIKTYPRIMNCIIYNYNEEIDFINSEEFNHIEFVKLKYNDFPYFKSLNDLRFLSMNPNIIKFAEAQKHNLYYHKKAYIESNGNVYNAPSTKEVHGNIFNQSILNIINNHNFQKYWKINKEMIDVCKDCEFRYSCIDNREPKKNKKTNNYFFTDECKYNPYKSIFNEN